MSENPYNKKALFLNHEISKINPKESRPKSSKQYINEKNIKNYLNNLKVFKNSINNQKPKLYETKLAKILLFSNSKNSIKIHNFHKEKLKHNELNNILFEDRKKLKNLEEKIMEQKKLIEKKKNIIKSAKDKNDNLKEKIKEKENNIEKIKKEINDYKNLNDDLTNKINDLKNNQNNNLDNSNLDNSNDLDINFENSRDREEAINYILSMMGDLPNQQYPNVDNMTYEELLELEEKMGKVSNGLTEEEIKKLKHEKFLKYKYLEEKCIICQYNFKELESIVVLPCNHCFHFPCIKPWITNQHYCPLCKVNIREEKK